MARRKDPTYVVLGTYDTPTKVCALDFKPACGKMALRIFELGNEDGKYAYGDMDAAINPTDIQFEYMRIYFCKKESLAALIRTLQRGYDRWDELEAFKRGEAE